MRKISAAILLAIAIVGCKDLKDQQRPDIVGDTKTKTYYKNTPTAEEKIPSNQRAYFKSRDEAEKGGYTNSQVGGGDSE